MPRALPILVIVGLAIYSLFDVLATPDNRIRRLSKPTWTVLVLIPVVGAALWFGVGRPRGRTGHAPPRMISLRGQGRPRSPDDDPEFLRGLDEQAWRRKRDEQRAKEQAEQQEEQQKQQKHRDTGPDHDGGTAPGGPGIAPAG